MTDPDIVAPALKADQEDESLKVARKRTLGNVRLRHHQTNEIILIPTPSNDPNDPLNWYAYVRSTNSRYHIILTITFTGRSGTSGTLQQVWSFILCCIVQDVAVTDMACN